MRNRHNALLWEQHGLRKRHRHDKRAAFLEPVALDPDRSLVHLNELFGERKPDAEALCFAHVRQALKGLKDMFLHLGCNADTIVAHAYNELSSLVDTRKIDTTAWVRIFNCIREQVDDNLLKTNPVDLKPHRLLGTGEKQPMPAGPQERIGYFDTMGHE